MNKLPELIQKLPSIPPDQWLDLIKDSVEKQAQEFEDWAINNRIDNQYNAYLNCAKRLRSENDHKKAKQKLQKKLFEKEIELGIRPTFNKLSAELLISFISDILKENPQIEAVFCDYEYDLFLVAAEHDMISTKIINDIEQILLENFGYVEVIRKYHQGRNIDFFTMNHWTKLTRIY